MVPIALRLDSPYMHPSSFGQTIGRFALAEPGARSVFLQKSMKRAYRRASARSKAHLHTAFEGHSMNKGTVKFYNGQRGYGFIQPDDGGKDVFVHATALERAGMSGLVEGQKVTFDTEEDRRSGKLAVGNIQAA